MYKVKGYDSFSEMSLAVRHGQNHFCSTFQTFKRSLSYSMHTKQATEESNLIKIKELNID